MKMLATLLAAAIVLSGAQAQDGGCRLGTAAGDQIVVKRTQSEK